MIYSIRNVIEAIRIVGHDEDFYPQPRDDWQPTDAIAGSSEKIAVLRSRIEQGMPLFHPLDNRYCRCPSALQKKTATIRVIELRHRRPALLAD